MKSPPWQNKFTWRRLSSRSSETPRRKFDLMMEEGLVNTLGFIPLSFSQTNFIFPVIQFAAVNTVPSIVQCSLECVG